MGLKRVTKQETSYWELHGDCKDDLGYDGIDVDCLDSDVCAIKVSLDNDL